jgi:heme-degrading monooxygenase HmoA
MPVITVFRSRLKPGMEAEYESLAEEISALAQTMPGYIEEKTFVAHDGERVTIVLFADRESHDAWRDHDRHREAQAVGKAKLYAEYRVYSAEIDYHRDFSSDALR